MDIIPITIGAKWCQVVPGTSTKWYSKRIVLNKANPFKRDGKPETDAISGKGKEMANNNL